MPAVDRPDITWSCSDLDMHGNRCSRPETCRCECHDAKETGRAADRP